MLAYTKEKSYLGSLGFDSLNFFTRDEVRYTGFEPTQFEISQIGKLIQRLNENFFSTEPMSLMVSKIEGVFVADIKVFRGLKMLRASGEGSSMGFVLHELERKVFL